VKATTQASNVPRVTHQTAETRRLDVGGVSFTYRRFGTPGASPLVLLQHFRGNVDNAALDRLTAISSPTLIIQGDGDLMIPTKLSHLMAGLIPDARIRIYPDAAHGFLFQYPTDVAAEVTSFLA
jgi:fermentation-respiration switch protein FrsA (DUF1100 family)